MKSELVAHLTSVHSPSDSRIFYKECVSLREAGYEVLLVAPHDRDDTVLGVTVKGVRIPRSRIERILLTAWNIYRAASARRISLCHLHDPELIGVGLLLKLRGKRVIYDVHEDLSGQVSYKLWIPTWLRPAVALLARLGETLAAFTFDHLVAATPSIAHRLPSSRTTIVHNYPLIHEFTANPRHNNRSRILLVVYAGGISTLRGAREMVKAMGLLPPALECRLVLAGRFFPPDLEGELSQLLGWERVEFVGWKPREALAELLSRASVGLVLFHPGPNHDESQPTKLFEYMAAGLPVIASNFPLWREIIEGESCGLLVDPHDPRAISHAIVWLMEHPVEAEDMGSRGREAVLRKYNWDAEAGKLVALYGTLLQ